MEWESGQDRRANVKETEEYLRTIGAVFFGGGIHRNGITVLFVPICDLVVVRPEDLGKRVVKYCRIRNEEWIDNLQDCVLIKRSCDRHAGSFEEF